MSEEAIPVSDHEGLLSLISMEGEGFILPVQAAILSELVRTMVDGEYKLVVISFVCFCHCVC
jgi:hypothetical protein